MVRNHLSAFLPSATKLRRLCFYTCLSVILLTGGGLPQYMLGYHPPPGTRHPPQQTATVTDGTHPTGMHSFFPTVIICHQDMALYAHAILKELNPHPFYQILTSKSLQVQSMISDVFTLNINVSISTEASVDALWPIYTKRQ